MPNIVKNIVTFSDASKVKELMGDGFDFNKIVEMPKSLAIPSGSIDNDALSYWEILHGETIDVFFRRSLDELKERYIDGESTFTEEQYIKGRLPIRTLGDLEVVAELMHRNLVDYGAASWYDWCYANWGTKLNAGGVCWNGNTVEFETAWSNVHDLLGNLSKMLHVDMEYMFADKDIGGINCGRYYIHDGAVEYCKPDDPIAFAESIWGIEDDF